MTLGERLRWIRGDLKQKEFAAKIGVTQTAVGYWERQSVIPKERDRQKICNIFGINYTWLVAGEGEPYMAGRKPPGISIPLKPGAREEGGGYPRPEERLGAGGAAGLVVYEEKDLPLIQARIISSLAEQLKEKDREIAELRRRLDAGEGDRARKPENIPGSSAAM